MIILSMDGKLIVQVLINLLDNSVMHTPPDRDIYLKVFIDVNEEIFEVSDFILTEVGVGYRFTDK